MVEQPTFFVLDDKMVAVFSVRKENCTIKMECLFSKTGIEDYTVEYQGPLEKKEKLIEYAITQAKNIVGSEIITM